LVVEENECTVSYIDFDNFLFSRSCKIMEKVNTLCFKPMIEKTLINMHYSKGEKFSVNDSSADKFLVAYT